jgi:nucleotide-binding universal stress UspA family protein
VSIFGEAEYDQSLVDAAAQQLSEIAATLVPTSTKVRTEVGTANDVGMERMRIAEHNRADVIIITTHGMTGWREIAFGSVAEKVVKQADRPVLLLPAKAEKETGQKRKTASSSSR